MRKAANSGKEKRERQRRDGACEPQIQPEGERRRGYSRAENIAGAAQGVDEFLIEIAIHFIAQPADQHVHDIGLRIEGVVPNVFENHRLRDDAPRIAQKIFEEGKFARLELDFFAIARDLAREQIKCQTAAAQASSARSVCEERRMSACTRASSSEKANGLVR